MSDGDRAAFQAQDLGAIDGARLELFHVAVATILDQVRTLATSAGKRAGEHEHHIEHSSKLEHTSKQKSKNKQVSPFLSTVRA